MKKYNIRNIAFLLLITASLFSYTYLSYVSLHDTTHQDSSIKAEEKIDEASIYVPDITLIKKVLSLGSRLL